MLFIIFRIVESIVTAFGDMAWDDDGAWCRRSKEALQVVWPFSALSSGSPAPPRVIMGLVNFSGWFRSERVHSLRNKINNRDFSE